MGALPVIIVMFSILILSVVIGYFGFPKRSVNGKNASNYISISNPISVYVENTDDSIDLVITESFEVYNFAVNSR